MKRDLKQQWREKSVRELEEALFLKRKELVEIRFKIFQGKLKNVRLASFLGDEIAILENILKEKKEKK